MKPPFQRLLDDHAAVLYRYCVASVGPVEADDCFQETVMAALRAYPRLRHADNLRGWLLTIAHNKALDMHRARSRRALPVGDVPETPTHDSERPDEELWAAVDALPPKQRGAVLLRFVGDLSHREIASALDSSEEAARRALSDGLAKLRTNWIPA